MTENPNTYQPNSPLGPQQRALPNATAVLVLGIISIVGCFAWGIVGLVCGIIALVLANKDRALYRSDPQSFTAGSYSSLNAGRTCSIIGLILSGLYMLFIIVWVVFIGAAMSDIWRMNNY